MKFGKELLRAADASDKIVPADAWIDYKVLKKMLKHNPMEDHNPASSSTPPPPPASLQSQKERITNSEVERHFFLALQAELRKVESQFSLLKPRALELARLSLHLDNNNKNDNRNDSNVVDDNDKTGSTTTTPPSSSSCAAQEDIRRCASAHLFLLMVENFGVLNYCGFKKILKKHDKLRGMTTRDSYMVRMVNNKSFSHSSEFRPLLEQLEAQYAALSSVASVEEREGGEAASFASQRKELEEIALQGNDRLKSLASVAVSMDEDEQRRKRQRDGDGEESPPSCPSSAAPEVEGSGKPASPPAANVVVAASTTHSV